MAEYISCRRCDSPDCKGCNLKRLETMLGNGKFDCLMNENRSINTSYDVAPVVHGRWIDMRESSKDVPECKCSECGCVIIGLEKNYCQNCGAMMDALAE